jgi:hypothetical protein
MIPKKNSIITINYPVFDYVNNKYVEVETQAKYLGQFTNKSHTVIVNYKLVYPLQFIFNTYKAVLIELNNIKQ